MALTPVHCWKNMVKEPTATRYNSAAVEYTVRPVTKARLKMGHTSVPEQAHIVVNAELEVRLPTAILQVRELDRGCLLLEDVLGLDLPENSVSLSSPEMD